MNSKDREALKNMWTTNQGQSLYLFNRDKLIRNFVSLQEAFRRYYSNTYIAYSYKTNHVTAICKTINDLGGLAECVSEFEYNFASNVVCVSGSNIIYNGVTDDDYSKQLAICIGSIVNVDSLEHLKEMTECYSRHKHLVGKFKVGLRIALDKNGGSNSRFGMTRDEVEKAIEYVDDIGGEISGIHCHVGGSRSIGSWTKRAVVMVEIAKYITSKTGKPVEYIDLGGHIYGNMDPALKLQFPDPIPSFEDYAKVVATVFNTAFGVNGPKLILEPGTALIADAVTILTKVVDVKRRGQKDIVTLDVSSYDCGMVADYKNLTIENVTRDDTTKNQEYAVHGYTCMEEDYINRSYVGELAKGDLVHILNTGAYSNVLKPPFIMPGIAMWMVDDNYRPLEFVKCRRSAKELSGSYISGLDRNLYGGN